MKWEDPDDAVDCLGGIDGVQGAQDQVARLGGDDRDADGLEIAHLSHKDDIRILTKRTAQGAGERFRIDPNFPLVDQATVVLGNLSNPSVPCLMPESSRRIP